VQALSFKLCYHYRVTRLLKIYAKIGFNILQLPGLSFLGDFLPSVRGRIMLGLLVGIISITSGCAIQLDHQPTRYALVYGVGVYGGVTISSGGTIGSLGDLPGARNDAVALRTVLSHQGYSTSINATHLGGEDTIATFTKMQSDINLVISVAKPGDTVLFYFAGHGAVVYEDSNGQEQLFFTTRSNTTGSTGTIETYTNARTFLIPGQASPVNRQTNDSDLLYLDTIQTLFSSFDPNINILIMIDACFAGGLIPSNSLSVNGLPQSYSQSKLYYQPPEETPILTATIEKFFTGSTPNQSNMFVLAASGALEESWEARPTSDQSTWFGVFTTIFRTAMTGNTSDLNRDGLVTLDEVYRQVYRNMMSQWNNFFNGRQEYLPHISGGSMDLVLFELF